MEYLLDYFEFDTILDIGPGLAVHTEAAARAGKEVHLIEPRTIGLMTDKPVREKLTYGTLHEMDFMDFWAMDETIDCIWCSHCLEHQLDTQGFLKNIWRLLKEGGVLAMIVPPLEYAKGIVGGHVSLWTPELLLYRLVMARFDCATAHMMVYGHNIGAIVTKTTIDPFPEMIGTGSREDLYALRRYFPPQMTWSSAPRREGRLVL